MIRFSESLNVKDIFLLCTSAHIEVKDISSKERKIKKTTIKKNQP
jgi:hypothetical protein